MRKSRFFKLTFFFRFFWLGEGGKLGRTVQYFARFGEMVARLGEAWRDKGDSRVLLAGIQKKCEKRDF